MLKVQFVQLQAKPMFTKSTFLTKATASVAAMVATPMHTLVFGAAFSCITPPLNCRASQGVYRHTDTLTGGNRLGSKHDITFLELLACRE